jgi:hypothetical protein
VHALGLSLDEYAKASPVGPGSGTKLKSRQPFMSPSKQGDQPGQVGSRDQSVKYVQMRRSQNNRILSHIRVGWGDQGSSIGDTRTGFTRLYQNYQPAVEKVHTSKDLGQYSPSKQSLKLRLKDAEQRDSAQKFSKILSLYDKSVADQLGRTDSKPLVPKFNLKSKEALADPLDCAGQEAVAGLREDDVLDPREGDPDLAQGHGEGRAARRPAQSAQHEAAGAVLLDARRRPAQDLRHEEPGALGPAPGG